MWFNSQLYLCIGIGSFDENNTRKTKISSYHWGAGPGRVQPIFLFYFLYRINQEGIILIIFLLRQTSPSTFTIGYLTGSQRLSGDLEYSRPGIQISGAITLALEEVNNKLLKSRGHELSLIVAETFGNEDISVLKTAELWRKNISVYIGPQETCVHEAIMATAFNLPMISYVSIFKQQKLLN